MRRERGITRCWQDWHTHCREEVNEGLRGVRSNLEEFIAHISVSDGYWSNLLFRSLALVKENVYVGA